MVEIAFLEFRLNVIFRISKGKLMGIVIRDNESVLNMSKLVPLKIRDSEIFMRVLINRIAREITCYLSIEVS